MGPLVLAGSVRSFFVTAENAVLVGWWTSDIARGDAVSQMLLLKLVLEFTFAILIPQGNITVQLVCCVPYVIH